MKKIGWYCLERFVEGDWYVWGTYASANDLAKAAAELGILGYDSDSVRVKVI